MVHIQAGVQIWYVWYQDRLVGYPFLELLERLFALFGPFELDVLSREVSQRCRDIRVWRPLVAPHELSHELDGLEEGLYLLL